jgi:hypothetical protein
MAYSSMPLIFCGFDVANGLSGNIYVDATFRIDHLKCSWHFLGASTPWPGGLSRGGNYGRQSFTKHVYTLFPSHMIFENLGPPPGDCFTQWQK